MYTFTARPFVRYRRIPSRSATLPAHMSVPYDANDVIAQRQRCRQFSHMIHCCSKQNTHRPNEDLRVTLCERAELHSSCGDRWWLLEEPGLDGISSSPLRRASLHSGREKFCMARCRCLYRECTIRSIVCINVSTCNRCDFALINRSFGALYLMCQ